MNRMSETRHFSIGLIVVTVCLLWVVWAVLSVNTTTSADDSTESEWSDLQGRIDSLEYRVSYLNRVVDDLVDHNPGVMIDWLSDDLDTLATGGNPRGSFSDFFVPTIRRLTKDGGHNEEVNELLDRLVALAQEGRYYNSSVRERVEGEGGSIENFRQNLENLRP